MIARYRARDVFRKRRTLPLQELEGHAPSCPTSSSDTEGALDRQLHSALATLPELHRSALTLRYFEELDYQSIEKLLGLTNGALRGILGRALASMRKQLKPALASLE
jgi:RNA polymerase sigma factor (sigma-70 family)